MRDVIRGVVPPLPALATDYFEFFGIERRLRIDTDALQKRFYDLSRQLHPDRFQLKSAEERQYSLDATALLNDAYRTLRDPMRRAEYVLKQEGFDIGEQRSKDVPPELLEEVFEWNMALEELRTGDSDARAQVDAAQARFEAMEKAIDSKLEEFFTAYDSSRDREVLGAIRAELNRRRYIRNLIGEAAKELNR